MRIPLLESTGSCSIKSKHRREERGGSFLTGATAAQRQIVREKWRVKSWKEAKTRGGGSGGLKSVRRADGCGLIVEKMRSVDTLIFRGTNFATIRYASYKQPRRTNRG